MTRRTSGRAALECPCGSAQQYEQCCGPLHDGAAAADAQALMRSRYSAYVLSRADYLLATWHPRTRPLSLDLLPGQPTWLGLQVNSHSTQGDEATVEFVARHRSGGGSAGRLLERSRFVREGGRWYYVDGETPTR